MKNKEHFFEKVYEIVKQIPYGRVSTYGAIAEHLGLRSGARLVGWALNADKENLDMPYHRVVNRNGELSGARYFPNPTMMRDLLEAEGIEFIGDSVDIKKYLWKP
ncbi:MAG: MGMT family protein [Candidatus Kapaibacterium sp.]|jgi:methylated-DNA-protein-cysteine methyltransferase-like protein|nr:MGMT family protein [Candidatus Kapabacteria bacterium]